MATAARFWTLLAMNDGGRSRLHGMLRLAVWALLAMASSTPLLAAVQLVADRDEYNLAAQVDVLADPSAQVDLEQARGSADWAPINGRSPVFGFATGAYWFRTSVVHAGHDEQRWVWLLPYALLDHIELHVIRADGSIEIRRSGDRLPFDSRDLKHRHFNFLIDIAAGERVELLLRVRTESSLQAPQLLITRSAFFARTHEAQAGMGLYYGILLALLLFNLIIYLSLREPAFGWYVVYVCSFGMAQLNLNGLAFEYLWPQSPLWANWAVPLTIAVGQTSMALFARTFLDLRKRRPILHRIFAAFIAFQLLMLAATPVIGYRAAILIETAGVLFIALLILTAAVLVMRDGFRPARYFLLAWSILLLGAVTYALVSFGVLPKVFLTEYGIQIGSALEMTLLSFALAFRIRDLEQEKQRLMQHSRDQLETQVAERTRDLNQALDKLGTLNQRLHEHSLRDGLTGAYNRRFLEQSLPAMLANCAESEQPLALLIVDLDHFKQINDRHGHLVGDDCLRAVSALLQGQLRNDSEKLVRWGGEEFVVLLPGSDRAAAVERAEQMRAELASHPSVVEDCHVPLRASIGVACAAANQSGNPEALLQAADQALYEAKRSGRNRVVLG